MNNHEDRRRLARRIATEYRRVIRGCLREEEWRDADEEFARLIFEGLSTLPDESTDASTCSRF